RSVLETGRHLQDFRAFGEVEHVRPFEETRERRSVLAIADEAEAARRGDATTPRIRATPATKREVQGHVLPEKLFPLRRFHPLDLIRALRCVRFAFLSGHTLIMSQCRRSAKARNRYAIASGPEGHGNIIPRGESIGSGGSALSRGSRCSQPHLRQELCP